jgi:hypothetical protein
MVPVPDISKPFNIGGVRIDDPIYDAAVPLPKESVQCFTIDSLNLQRCDLMKIDVEAMESKVIRGAMATIRRCRPIIFAEFLFGQIQESDDRNNSELVRLLQEQNYDARVVTLGLSGNSRFCPDDIFPGGDRNVIAIPKERDDKPEWFERLDVAK